MSLRLLQVGSSIKTTKHIVAQTTDSSFTRSWWNSNLGRRIHVW